MREEAERVKRAHEERRRAYEAEQARKQREQQTKQKVKEFGTIECRIESDIFETMRAIRRIETEIAEIDRLNQVEEDLAFREKYHPEAFEALFLYQGSIGEGEREQSRLRRMVRKKIKTAEVDSLYDEITKWEIEVEIEWERIWLGAGEVDEGTSDERNRRINSREQRQQARNDTRARKADIERQNNVRNEIRRIVAEAAARAKVEDKAKARELREKMEAAAAKRRKEAASQRRNAAKMAREKEEADQQRQQEEKKTRPFVAPETWG
jgi:hypothetical protein